MGQLSFVLDTNCHTMYSYSNLFCFYNLMTQKNLEKEEFSTVGACAAFVEEFNAQV